MKKYLAILLLAVLASCSTIYEDFPVPPASTVAQFEIEVVNEETREVNFINTSIIPESKGNVTYTWSFGDGTTSSEESPTHLFPAYGEYEVKLVLIVSGNITETSTSISLLQPINIDFALYFMDTDFQRIKAVGTADLEFEVPGFGNGIAIDNEAGKIYYVDDDNIQVLRANLDGSEAEVLYDDFSGVSNIALDTDNSKIYWTNRQDGTVHRGNLDGSGSSEVIITGLSLPEGIAYLDGNIYISDVDVPPVGENIYRADPSGSNLEVYVPGSWGYGMGADPVNGRIYFGDQGVFDDPNDNRIKSVSISDRSDIKTVAILEPVGGNGSRTYGIAIRPEEGSFYWSDRNTRKVKKAPLEGGSEETLLVAEGTPRGIAIAE